MAVLEVRNLCKVYTSLEANVPSVEALKHIKLTVNKGEFISIIGPSGCGKSTLFALIGGLNECTSGEVLIEGERVKGPHPFIGMVFQEESAFPWLTTLENVEFGLRMAGMGRKERRTKAKAIVEIVGLSEFENHYPGELSGGMRQRVAIARTLVMDPEIILMDEPFGALDEQTRVILGEELLRICGRIGATILFITHSISESVMLSDRVYVMSSRPGTFKKTINIDIPRPRSSLTLSTRRFGEITEEIWKELKEETTKAMNTAGSPPIPPPAERGTSRA
jgi:NitT/TauT family transport system ATP-binding protein